MSRTLWRPKRKEVKSQCVSCPFKEGNDKELGEVMRRIFGIKKPDTFLVRERIKADLTYSGDFICHGTIYGNDGVLGSEKEREKTARQCAGATKWFKQQPNE